VRGGLGFCIGLGTLKKTGNGPDVEALEPALQRTVILPQKIFVRGKPKCIILN
jgi:hypothetical protein